MGSPTFHIVRPHTGHERVPRGEREFKNRWSKVGLQYAQRKWEKVYRDTNRTGYGMRKTHQNILVGSVLATFKTLLHHVEFDDTGKRSKLQIVRGLFDDDSNGQAAKRVSGGIVAKRKVVGILLPNNRAQKVVDALRDLELKDFVTWRSETLVHLLNKQEREENPNSDFTYSRAMLDQMYSPTLKSFLKGDDIKGIALANVEPSPSKTRRKPRRNKEKEKEKQTEEKPVDTSSIIKVETLLRTLPDIYRKFVRDLEIQRKQEEADAEKQYEIQMIEHERMKAEVQAAMARRKAQMAADIKARAAGVSQIRLPQGISSLDRLSQRINAQDGGTLEQHSMMETLNAQRQIQLRTAEVRGALRYFPGVNPEHFVIRQYLFGNSNFKSAQDALAYVFRISGK
eukprot:TRINITY_DN7995_c0_g2_i1.p1 TRINITY_DN7995_c0_g2~~TRINITY_DN7995_c0_g2_i1.p1  ORF type:complete len:398 (+),score=75.91 TRINITY_DN7995_c0_g2_i1:528-1721(+)